MRKFFFLQFFILSSLFSFSQALILDLPFTNGDTTDLSFNGNNATVHGATPVADRFGNPNSAYHLDGVNDYMAIRDIDGIRTIAFWYKLDLPITGITAPFIYKQYEFDCYFDPPGSIIPCSYGSNLPLGTNLPNQLPNDENFHFVVWTIDTINNYQYLYFDGLAIDTESISSIPTGSDSLLLGYNPSYIEYFKGVLDDIQCYNYPLTQNTINNIYHQGHWGLPCSVAYYPFTGGSLTDETGNGYNLTAANGLPSSVADRFGNQGNAFLFDTSKYLITTANQLFYMNGDASVSFWFKFDTLLNDTNIMTYVLDTLYDGYTILGVALLHTSADTLLIAHDTAYKSPEIIKVPYHFTANEWHHVAVARNLAGRYYKTYIDGMERGTDTILQLPLDTLSQMQGLIVGEQGNMGFNGKIDDVNFYQCAIDDYLVDSLYTYGHWGCNPLSYSFSGTFEEDSLHANPFTPTVSGNVVFTEDRFGVPDNAIHLIDTTGLEIDSFPASYVNGNNSVSLWFKVDSLPSNDTSLIVMARGDNYNDYYAIALFPDTNLYLGHVTNGNMVLVGPAQLYNAIGEWNHIAMIRDTSLEMYYVYLNDAVIYSWGYSQYQVPYTGLDTATIVLSDKFPQNTFYGSYDDIVFFKCQISPEMVDSLYHIGMWQMNQCDSLHAYATITDASCGNNDDGMIIIDSITGGSGFYDYMWSNGDTTSLADSLEAGTYTLQIHDNGMGCDQVFYFQVNNTGGANLLITSTPIDCHNGNNGSATVTITGGLPPYTVHWSNGATTETINGLYAGTYGVTVTDQGGCISSDAVSLSDPLAITLDFNSNNSDCGSANGWAQVIPMGGAGNYDYSWSNSVTGTDYIDNLGPNVYTVTVTDDNGCEQSGDVAISENGAPFVAIDSVQPAPCGGTGNIFVTTSGGTFQWSTGDMTEDLIGQNAGTYYLTVTDGGCQSVVNATIPPVLPEEQPICVVSVDTTTGTNMVIWEKVQTSNIDFYKIYREGSIPGDYIYIDSVPFDSMSVYNDLVANPMIRSWRYKISAVDICGNESPLSDAHKTIHLNLNLALGGNINLIWDNYEGFPYYTFYIMRHQASSGWTVLDSLPNNMFSYTDTTTNYNGLWYIVTVKTPAPCVPTSSTKVNGGPFAQSISNLDDYGVNTGNNSVYVHDGFDDILIYPNPAKERCSIIGKSLLKIEVMDMNGQVLQSQTFSPVNLKTIDVSGLTPGIYLIKAVTKTGSYVRKVIVEKR